MSRNHRVPEHDEPSIIRVGIWPLAKCSLGGRAGRLPRRVRLRGWNRNPRDYTYFPRMLTCVGAALSFALLVPPSVVPSDGTPLLQGTQRALPPRAPTPLLVDKQPAETDPLQVVKDAGIAGIVSYFCVEITFFAIALPTGYFLWHWNTGEWLQPLLLVQEGSGEDKVRLVGLILSYVVLLKTLFPVRLGATLLLTPVMKGILGSDDESS